MVADGLIWEMFSLYVIPEYRERSSTKQVSLAPARLIPRTARGSLHG